MHIFVILDTLTNVQLFFSGYMSPEYAMNGIVSKKTDVFSFGVLVLEIVSGRKNTSCYHIEHPINLVGYVSIHSKYIFIKRLYEH